MSLGIRENVKLKEFENNISSIYRTGSPASFLFPFRAYPPPWKLSHRRVSPHVPQIYANIHRETAFPPFLPFVRHVLLSSKYFFPPNRTGMYISGKFKRISLSAGVLFIDTLNCRPGEKERQRKPQNGRKSRKIRPEKSEAQPPRCSYITPSTRDDCPFIFNEGYLIRTVARHVRLNPFWRLEKKKERERAITIFRLASFSPIKSNALVTRYNKCMIEKHRSRGKTNDFPWNRIFTHFWKTTRIAQKFKRSKLANCQRNNLFSSLVILISSK